MTITSEQIAAINNVSPSFCLAKWLQVTIDLVHGTTHSCHHPKKHKIPLEELLENPSALHNTKSKKEKRKLMLEGKRPIECDYCWKIEDLDKNHLSDRFIKSADFWAYDELEKIAQMPWDANVTPKYLEVMIGRECNFSCTYCNAEVSSSIVKEIKEFGSYNIKQNGFEHRCQGIDIDVPVDTYRQAFWSWLPEICNELRVLRITGGEPLLNKDFFKILDFLEENPNPSLHLALNSNLDVPTKILEKAVKKIKKLETQKKIKQFDLYTSLDSFGEQSEYIRHGLSFSNFHRNMTLFCKLFPNNYKVINCTYNILSIPGFRRLLDYTLELKNQFDNIWLDISYLKDPDYLCANLITEDLYQNLENDLSFMKKPRTIEKNGFSDYEIAKFERVLDWLKTRKNDSAMQIKRVKFYRFITEFDKRKKRCFESTFPELRKFYNSCKATYLYLKPTPGCEF